MPNERLLQKKGRTDGRTDRRHKPRVEVSLDGIPTTGLREEVSRPVATCQKSWVGYALKKRAMPNERLLLKKKTGSGIKRQ